MSVTCSFMNWLLNWIVSREPTHRAGSACFVLLGLERSVEELRSDSGELELWLVFPGVSVFQESTKEHLVKVIKIPQIATVTLRRKHLFTKMTPIYDLLYLSTLIML